MKTLMTTLLLIFACIWCIAGTGCGDDYERCKRYQSYNDVVNEPCDEIYKEPEDGICGYQKVYLYKKGKVEELNCYHWINGCSVTYEKRIYTDECIEY